MYEEDFCLKILRYNIKHIEKLLIIKKIDYNKNHPKK